MRALVALAVVCLAGCGQKHDSGGVLPDQSCFRLTFGVTDTAAADWSGSVEISGGRIVSLAPWRFDKEDKIDAPANSWICSTRMGAVLDPKHWWLGATHEIPKDMTPPKASLIPNGIYITVESGQLLRMKTRQGSFDFRITDLRAGEPATALNRRVEIERVPTAQNITAGDGLEDDFPSVAFDTESNAWIAWTSYQKESEKLFVARTNGADRQMIAEGEFFRPSLARGQNGTLYLVVSVHVDNTWKVAVATRQDAKWGKLEFLSNGGPDLGPRAAVDTKGRLWVVWQGLRESRSKILARRMDGAKWSDEVAVSENRRNAWEPSIAADSKGGMHVAWDAYDHGNYDIFYRFHDGEKFAEMRRITTSVRFEAHASIVCDRSNRPWIAFDNAGANWGKDTGFLITKNTGEALYEGRRIQAVVVTGSDLLSPRLPEGFLEQPQLVGDVKGNVWALARRRMVKLHEVWSPTLRKNRLQQYSFWDYVVMRIDGGAGVRPISLPFSWGRNDLRAGIAASAAGRLAVVWAGDGRSFSKPYPSFKNDIFAADLPGVPYGQPTLTEWPEPEDEPAPVHSKEAAAVEKVRAERLDWQGKKLRVLRGDMHRHTDLSFDGDIDGSLWDFYRYTMDAADLDYAAVTDHNAGDDNEYFWWLIQKSNDLYHYPGRFAPMYAYERSLLFPNGHRNLVWAKRGIRTLPRSKAEEDGLEGAAKLYEYLRRSGGLAMSHTTATLSGTDWRDNDPAIEPLVEIYQGDRTSYEHEGAPRAATAKNEFSQAGGFKPEGFVWNAWAKGFKLGVQASSDHSSTHVSYAALLAEDLTREAILNAIRARHAYAATDNIVLDVRCEGQIQGDIFPLGKAPRLEVRVEGTALVEKVEVVKNNKFVYANKPKKSSSVTFSWEDTDSKPGQSYYYVRVLQADGQMAWSSPMWITRNP